MVTWSLHVAMGYLAGKGSYVICSHVVSSHVVDHLVLFGGNKFCPLYSKRRRRTVAERERVTERGRERERGREIKRERERKCMRERDCMRERERGGRGKSERKTEERRKKR